MPFIRTSTNIPISDEKLNNLKTRYGKAINIMGKQEDYLMLEFSDNNKMFFQGSNNPLAFIDVKVLGTVSNSNEMTKELNTIINEELGINNIYIAYQGYSEWGYNGHNF